MMNSVRITYDPEGDTLYIAFGEPRGATGYQLADQILLRVEPNGNTPVGLTIFNFMSHSGAKRIAIDEVDAGAADALASAAVRRFIDVRKENGGLTARLRQPSLREAVAAI